MGESKSHFGCVLRAILWHFEVVWVHLVIGVTSIQRAPLWHYLLPLCYCGHDKSTLSPLQGFGRCADHFQGPCGNIRGSAVILLWACHFHSGCTVLHLTPQLHLLCTVHNTWPLPSYLFQMRHPVPMSTPTANPPLWFLHSAILHLPNLVVLWDVSLVEQQHSLDVVRIPICSICIANLSSAVIESFVNATALHLCIALDGRFSSSPWTK